MDGQLPITAIVIMAMPFEGVQSRKHRCMITINSCLW